MKQQIIAHRGGAGLELENSLNALKKSVALGVALEIDVRLTADHRLVLCHDPTLARVAGDTRQIRRHSYKDLRDVKLKDGSPLLTLEEALGVIGSTPVVIELKDRGSAPVLHKILADFPQANAVSNSFRYSELTALKKLEPGLLLYVTEIARPFRAIRFSQRHGLGGVALFWPLLNPLTYWYARRADLQIYVWTVNNRFVGRLIRRLYPQVKICTNYPNRFI